MTTYFHFHTLAEIFPLMSDDEFNRLVDDIRANGQREPIWIYQGKIIDGRNRYNACQVLKIEPITREWDGKGSLVSFVVSLNLHRRHLSPSQRADVASKLVTYQFGDNQHKVGAQNQAPISQNDAAKLLNVSRSLVQSATKVQTDGVEELKEKVASGEITVSKAAQIAALPKTKQIRLIRKGREKGQKILNDLKIKSLQKINKDFKTPCLLCNPEATASKESVSALMQLLSKKHPQFARYFNSVVDELEEMELADSVQDGNEKIKAAIRAGYQTFSEIQQMTGIEKDNLNYSLSLMVEYGEIVIAPQGGKTDGARGARKVLYQIGTMELDV